jgi:hypothetical protein
MVEDVRRALMEGLGSVPAAGAVLAGQGPQLPFVVVNCDGEELEAVSAYLRDLMLGDVSPLTCRSYAFDLLRWYRLLWCLGIGWEKATRPRSRRWWAGCGLPGTRSGNAGSPGRLRRDR